jgi:hypothetical protein
MSDDKTNPLIGQLSWQNFRRYLPNGIEEIRGAWTGNEDSEKIEKWYALLMDAVHSVTSEHGASYPPSLYAHPGEIRQDAVWTDEIRGDLVQELFSHLFNKTRGHETSTGNQFIYIDGASREVRQARNLILKHLRRVLLSRFTKTEFGRTNERIRTMLNQAPFIDTTPGISQFRQKRFGLEGFEENSGIVEDEVIDDAAREFSLMKRNSPQLGIVELDRDQRSPRWYETEELRNAVIRIIRVVAEGPISLDLISNALQLALADLDIYAESLENPPGMNILGAGNTVEKDVQSGQVSSLLGNVEVLLDDISAARIEALGFLTQLDPVRDIMMLAWKANGYTIEAIGQKVGVNEKTVRRRLDAITKQSKGWILAYGERAVGLALSEIIREAGVGENLQ